MKIVLAIFFGIFTCLVMNSVASAAACKSWSVTYTNPLPGKETGKTTGKQNSAKKAKEGIAGDIVSEIGKRVNCTLSSQEKPRAQALQVFSKGHSVIYAVTFQSDALDQVGTFVPLYTVHRGLIVRREYFEPGKIVAEYLRDPKIHFADLNGRRPYLTETEEQTLIGQKRLLQAAHYKDCLQMLRDGSVQAVFASPLAIQELLKENPVASGVEYVEDPKFSVSEGLYFSNDKLSPVEKASLQQALTAMKEDGTVKSILSRYIRPEYVDRDITLSQ